MLRAKEKYAFAHVRLTSRLCACLALFSLSSLFAIAYAQAGSQELAVSASFADKSVSPRERIELRLNRLLKPAEGRLAIVISRTDVTDLFEKIDDRLVYNPDIMPLPQGESQLIVYIVSGSGEWKDIAKFLVRVLKDGETANPNPQSETQKPEAVETTSQQESDGNKTPADTRAI